MVSQFQHDSTSLDLDAIDQAGVTVDYLNNAELPLGDPRYPVNKQAHRTTATLRFEGTKSLFSFLGSHIPGADKDVERTITGFPDFAESITSSGLEDPFKVIDFLPLRFYSDSLRPSQLESLNAFLDVNFTQEKHTSGGLFPTDVPCIQLSREDTVNVMQIAQSDPVRLKQAFESVTKRTSMIKLSNISSPLEDTLPSPLLEEEENGVELNLESVRAYALANNLPEPKAVEANDAKGVYEITFEKGRDDGEAFCTHIKSAIPAEMLETHGAMGHQIKVSFSSGNFTMDTKAAAKAVSEYIDNQNRALEHSRSRGQTE